MSLQIDENFERNTGYNNFSAPLPDLSKYKFLDMEAYDRYKEEKFSEDVKGESFKARIILARELKDKGSTLLEIYFETYNLKTHASNVFRGKIRNYVRNGIEQQSAKMHDFLSLCVAQNPKALNDSFEFRKYEETATIYPNLAGLVFFLNIAKTGLFKNDKGIYPTYSWKFYNTDKFTEEEIETGAKEPIKFDDDLNWLKNEYQKFLANPTPSEAKDNKAGYGKAKAPAKQQELPPAVEQVPAYIDDELPF